MKKYENQSTHRIEKARETATSVKKRGITLESGMDVAYLFSLTKHTSSYFCQKCCLWRDHMSEGGGQEDVSRVYSRTMPIIRLSSEKEKYQKSRYKYRVCSREWIDNTFWSIFSTQKSITMRESSKSSNQITMFFGISYGTSIAGVKAWLRGLSWWGEYGGTVGSRSSWIMS